MKHSRIPLWTTVLLLVFFYAPLVLMVMRSFGESRFGKPEDTWSIRWYMELIQNRAVLKVTYNTLVVGLFTTLFSTVLGTLSALAIHKYHGKLQMTHQGLLYIPLLLPEILMGISLLVCFASAGIPQGHFTVIAAHVSFCTSYVAVVILTSLADVDFTLMEAARDLGASSWQATTRVLLPLLWPGIVAGALLAFTLSLDDFIVTYFVSGKDCETLPVFIFNSHRREPALVYALSSTLLFFTFILVSVATFFQGHRKYIS